MIRFVTFASEGPPHDKALPIGTGVLEELCAYARDGGATTATYYTPRMLGEADKWSVQSYEGKHRMSANKGYASVGFGAWKSVIIRDELKKSQDGDIVVYSDANFPRYPLLKSLALRLLECVNIVMRWTDFFMPPHVHVGKHCAREVLNLIPDSLVRDKVSKGPLGRACLIVIKVNQKTRDFIGLWESIMKKDMLLLSPLGKTSYPGMKLMHTTAEQSLLNVLAYREGLFPVQWPGSWLEIFRTDPVADTNGFNKILECGKIFSSPPLIDVCLKFITGEIKEKDWKYAIIIQGPRGVSHEIVLKETLSRTSDDTLVIVSSYISPEDLPEDNLMGHERLVWLFLVEPSRTEYPWFWKTNYRNQNLQRLSSFFGLMYAQDLGIRWSLKLRSDSFIGRRNAPEYLEQKSMELPVDEGKSPVESRIVISDRTRLIRDKLQRENIGEYFIHDHWLFGMTCDLIRWFDIRDESAWARGSGIATNTSAETHIAQCWLRNIGIQSPLSLEQVAAKYLYVVNTTDLEVLWLKTDCYQKYLSSGKAYIQRLMDCEHRFGKKHYNHERWANSLSKECIRLS